MTNKRRDRAIQLVEADASVDFTSTHCCYQHTHKKQQRDNANKIIEFVTDNSVSVINCPIEVGIVPLSSLTESSLTKQTMRLSAHKHEQRDSENETIVIVTHKVCSAVSCPIKVVIVPVSWLLLRYLLIAQSTHCCQQHTNTNRNTKKTQL